MPQLGMSTWWKVAGSAGVCIQKVNREVKIDPSPEPVKNINISLGVRHFSQGDRMHIIPLANTALTLCDVNVQD